MKSDIDYYIFFYRKIAISLIGGGMTDELLNAITNFATDVYQTKILSAIEDEVLRVAKTHLNKINMALAVGKPNFLESTQLIKLKNVTAV